MDRRFFLKILGLSGALSLAPKPKVIAEQPSENPIRVVDGIIPQIEEDPFWHFRKLMDERALPNSSYQCFVMRDERKELRYDVVLIQNGLLHRESTRHENFSKREQEWLFEKLMGNVQTINSWPESAKKVLRDNYQRIKNG